MDFLRKSLFLVLFLGFVSISFCDEEKREDDDENHGSEEKREIHEEGNQEERRDMSPPWHGKK
uniref:Tryptophyllin-2 precusor n=1 Tax=Agalychnis dacnicolor TaxID=75988 RepID=C7C1L9_AGADC|nr:tryptophyllin-2 precusor [Agalychnis dacnicolor]